MTSPPVGGADAGTAWRLVHDDVARLDDTIIAELTDGTPLLPLQAQMMVRLWRHPQGRSPMNALAVDLGVSGSSLTKLVDRLTDLDLARRDASDRDRRVMYIVLTPAGAEQARDLHRRYAGILRKRVLATVGVDGLRALAGTATQLHAVAAPD